MNFLELLQGKTQPTSPQVQAAIESLAKMRETFKVRLSDLNGTISKVQQVALAGGKSNDDVKVLMGERADVEEKLKALEASLLGLDAVLEKAKVAEAKQRLEAIDREYGEINELEMQMKNEADFHILQYATIRRRLEDARVSMILDRKLYRPPPTSQWPFLKNEFKRLKDLDSSTPSLKARKEKLWAERQEISKFLKGAA